MLSLRYLQSSVKFDGLNQTYNGSFTNREIWNAVLQVGNSG